MRFRTALVCSLMLVASFASAEWKPAAGPLMTRWAKQVDPSNVLPEYPRPQFVRKDWMNLNGLWDYAITDRKAEIPTKWDGEILVPFPIESALSGVMKPVAADQVLWYRRKFTLPKGATWDHQRIALHFGAVDWQCEVFVNGSRAPGPQASPHRGGFDPFNVYLDMPGVKLNRAGENELVVKVWDPTDASHQPRGKQLRKPEGIWYTPVTGIWQTVWLEPVPLSPIGRLKITPDVDQKQVIIDVDAGNETKIPTEAPVKVEVLDGDKVIATAEGVSTNGHAIIKIPLDQPHLWTPSDPHLYSLKVERPGQDSVSSYFGMRKIAVQKDEKGINRMFLNNKPLFQFGPLDQGWWPDGLYTAPTDEALKFDIQATKDLGFNMARKHVKVEPDRWYYWCDKLGLLVWQDMPSGDKYIGPNDPDSTRSEASEATYRREWDEIIRALYNHPSIVVWVPFNEGWGQFKTNEILEFTKSLDPTRIVDGPSGWSDRGGGDMHDMHHYPGPAMFPVEDKRASVLGEFGGLGLPLEGHTWLKKGNWGYRSFESKEALTAEYDQFIAQLPLLIGDGLAAAVYTQTTDVEIEVNGLLTYDREVFKMDPQRVAKMNSLVYGPPPKAKTLVPTSDMVPQEWTFTTAAPAEGWEKADFDAKSWKSGLGGLGALDPPGTKVRTTWNTPEIWARREFELASNDVSNLWLRIHHDEDAEIYLNGTKIAETHGYTTQYILIPTRAEAKAALKAGKNTLAVHCKQTGGGQYIDVGLVDVRFGD
jgi:hypothetical protein